MINYIKDFYHAIKKYKKVYNTTGDNKLALFSAEKYMGIYTTKVNTEKYGLIKCDLFLDKVEIECNGRVETVFFDGLFERID